MTELTESVTEPIITEPEPLWRSRHGFVRDVYDRLAEALVNAEHVIEGGPEDGVKAVTHKAWREALITFAALPLPPADQHAAEVATGATILVWARCPRCGISAPITMTVDPELRVDPAHAELHLKAKSKGRYHACGQLPLPAAPFDGQITVSDLLDESDREALVEVPGDGGTATETAEVTVTEDEPEVPMPCPYPGCDLPTDHAGNHRTIVDDVPGGEA